MHIPEHLFSVNCAQNVLTCSGFQPVCSLHVTDVPNLSETIPWADLRWVLPPKFAALHFTVTGCLIVCGCLGVTAFLLKKKSVLTSPLLNIPESKTAPHWAFPFGDSLHKRRTLHSET